MSLCLEALLARDDVKVLAIFALNKPGNSKLRSLAAHKSIKLFLEPIHLEYHKLIIDKTDMILTAGYTKKVPELGIRFPLNLHPSLLPMGRGGRSIPWILFDQPEAAGVTLHVLTGEYDAGPIVASQSVAHAETLSFEAYLMTCSQFGVELISCFLTNPEKMMQSAQSQDLINSVVLPEFPQERRLILPSMPGSFIVDMVRRLGPIGAQLDIGGKIIKVTGAEFVSDPGLRPHKAFDNNSYYSSLRCKDGFIIFRPKDLHQS